MPKSHAEKMTAKKSKTQSSKKVRQNIVFKLAEMEDDNAATDSAMDKLLQFSEKMTKENQELKKENKDLKIKLAAKNQTRPRYGK